MRETRGNIKRIYGSIILIVAVAALAQPLQSQMVNRQERIKSNALIWLFQEVGSIEYFFTVKESLYEPSLLLEGWMFDVESYSISLKSEENILYEDVFYEPELKFENWMVDMKCFCKDLPEKFCEEILELEDWMCCPFKIK